MQREYEANQGLKQAEEFNRLKLELAKKMIFLENIEIAIQEKNLQSGASLLEFGTLHSKAAPPQFPSSPRVLRILMINIFLTFC